MKTLLILFGLVLVLSAGCVSNKAIGSTYPENQEGIGCGDICAGLETTGCVGSWAVNGTYPDCHCTFQCVE